MRAGDSSIGGSPTASARSHGRPGEDSVLRYEKIFQASAGLLATVDANGRFRDLNPTWERVLGWSLAELKRKPFVEIVHPGDREVTLRRDLRRRLDPHHRRARR